MTTKNLRWQKIARLAAGIAASMVPMAWGQELYQTHNDGSIWEYTGTPRNSVGMGVGGQLILYEMHSDLSSGSGTAKSAPRAAVRAGRS
jgi:hypothetical protein